MPPGQEGKITLAVEHTESYAGEVAKSANVTTNDPVYPNFNLVLKALFKSDQPTSPAALVSPPPMTARHTGPFMVLPNDRWVTSVITGTSSSTRMSLSTSEAKPVHIKKVVSGGTNFNVNLQTIEDGKRYELAIATNPVLKPGHYEQSVQLMTDNAQMPVATLMLEVTVFAKVFVRPSSITLQPVALDSDLSAISLPLIYVQRIREGGLKINSISCTLPFVRLEVTTQKEGEIYSIRIVLDKSKIPGVGRYSGKVRIQTNDSDASAIEVPVNLAFN